ncbi:MAG: DNA-processing protein DprA [Prevotella sp.]|nr:DNA-processing protein DprA [Prevotella sp.]
MIDFLILSQLAMGQYGLGTIKSLYDEIGSAEGVVRKLGKTFKEEELRAKEEIAWCEKNNVTILTISDADYPDRLRHCCDAPLAIFTRGKANLNAPHIISIVGTRKCTTYGKEVINQLVGDLAMMLPDIVIVSGLAYGIDINAHRAALNKGLSTVGVVAHGQDTLYPSLHRNEANKMCLGNGGVITEFFHGTRSLAPYFLQRNRIIAGMSDATIVVESALHGGGLVTARLAQDYNREVFAVPGPVNSSASEGTNNLIRDNKATLITSAQDIMDTMQWQNVTLANKKQREAKERLLFLDLTPDEQKVIDYLKQHGDTQTNILAMNTAIPIGSLSALLFSLEMKGVVRPLFGNTYHLV